MSEPFVHIRSREVGAQVTGDPARILGHRIERAGDEIADGIYAEWSWDGTTLRVRNDRYGFYPLYYYASRDQIMVSTSIARLLAAGAPCDLDDAALAAFLRLGFMLGEDTPFSAIRALPPQALLEWRGGALTVRGGWSPGRTREMSRDAAIEGYIELFRTSIARRRPAREPVIVPLSGGRDSRHILYELNHQGLRPAFCLTYSGEAEVASAISRALNMPHKTIEEERRRLPYELRKNLETGFCAFEHTWYIPVADQLNRFAGSIYDGIGGDVLSAGLFLTRERHEMIRAGKTSELAADLFTVVPDKVIARTLQPEYARRFCYDAALARFEDECRRHVDAANPIGSFHFWNRTRRLITLIPYRLLAPVAHVYSPYLDHDLFDHLSTLPARHFFDHTFHTETIHRAFPQYAHLPFAEKSSISQPGGSYYRRYARDVLEHLWRAGRQGWMRQSYFIPRLLRCLLDPRYTDSAEWLGSLALYYSQLETARREEHAHLTPSPPPRLTYELCR